MKVAFFELEKWEEEYIKNALPGHDLYLQSDKLDENNASAVGEVDIISTFIYSNINQNIIDRLPNIKLLATRSTGFDHINIDSCKSRNIVVSNVPTYGEHTVAEHTFSLILALSRKIVPSIDKTRRGDFSLDGLRGFDLHGKTIGVIGCGHIGRRVIDIARGFGMNILVFTPNPDPNMILPDLKFVSLQELLASSDIVTLHVPLNEQTKHLINRDNIKLFKKGSVLINTSRGAVAETLAVLDGLQMEILAGAGLDVLEEECFLHEERELLTSEFLKTCDIKTQLLNHVLITRPNVIVTPHNAFNSKEALSQILETTVSNIKSFIDGKPQNIVV